MLPQYGCSKNRTGIPITSAYITCSIFLEENATQQQMLKSLHFNVIDTPGHYLRVK